MDSGNKMHSKITFVKVWIDKTNSGIAIYLVGCKLKKK